MIGIVKVSVVSLGCPKNQCDAELMLAKINNAGYKLVDEPGLADVVVINTCGFIQGAKEEAIEEIFEATQRKEDGINKKIIITGCLAERYREQLENEFPEIDGIVGIARNDNIVEIINSVLLDNRTVIFGDKNSHNMEGERLVATLPNYAYLRIADGCDNCCSYCAIPLIRGNFRSRKMENIIEEANRLVQDGAKEIILVAQDTTRYGQDLYNKFMLPELLEKLCEISDLKWIRLLYCYPEHMTTELIQVMKNQEKIVKYIDLPIQHCNLEILESMNRKSNQETLRELISTLRREIPGMVIRSTVIVGFPGETEEQFNELAEFLNEIKFERLGCFAYSQEEGTPAFEFPYQVHEAERKHRAEIINEQQEVRMDEFNDDLIGTEMEIVVEGFDRYFEMFFGRSYMFAPEIDGMIYFSGKDVPLFDFVKIKIVEVVENNLIGEMISEFSQ